MTQGDDRERMEELSRSINRKFNAAQAHALSVAESFNQLDEMYWAISDKIADLLVGEIDGDGDASGGLTEQEVVAQHPDVVSPITGLPIDEDDVATMFEIQVVFGSLGEYRPRFVEAFVTRKRERMSK